MNKIRLVSFLIFLLTLSCFKNVNAQSAIWASGWVELTYVGDGSNSCNGPKPYHITLHFYRDCQGGLTAFPPSKDILAFSEELGIDGQTYTLALESEEGVVEEYCLNNATACTEGAIYKTQTPINIGIASDWEFVYFDSFRSPENYNIEPGQDIFVNTRLDNTACGNVQTDANGVPPDASAVNFGQATTAQFVIEEPVASFCIGKYYEYKIPAFDRDSIDDDGNYYGPNDPRPDPSVNPDFNLTALDQLSFQLTATKVAPSQSAMYVGGFGPVNPFPTDTFEFDQQRGILKFRPTQPFVGNVTFRILEKRRKYYIDSICPSATCVPGDSVAVLRSNLINVSQTWREMRFIFDNACKEEIPEFEGLMRSDLSDPKSDLVSTYDATKDAQVFNCADTKLTFALSEPMLCSSVDTFGFRIGKGYNSIDTLAAFVTGYRIEDCDAVGEFDTLTIFLDDPIGPGEYNLFLRTGRDENTIVNRCDYSLPINQPLARIFIQDNYEYYFDKGLIEYCFPADTAQLVTYSETSPDFFTWRYLPNFPSYLDNNGNRIDSVFKLAGGDKNTIRIDTADDGIWEIGVGYDFSEYDPFTGDTITQRLCYDTDIFNARKFINPPVIIPDYDLCPEDAFPVINLDSMTTKHKAIVSKYLWKYVRGDRQNASKSQSDEFQVVRAANDTLKTANSATQVGATFTYTSEVHIPIASGRICIEYDTFLVTKRRVDVKIGRDSIICEGEQYTLSSQIDYYEPERMGYQWYLDDNILADDTLPEIKITGKGEYKLEVSKTTTIGSICIGRDSVDINVVDSLFQPKPECSKIKFEDGQVKQKFFWEFIEGADGYEVREVNPVTGSKSDWLEPNGEYNQLHNTIGQQIQLEVRAVNIEVPEEAICKWSEIGSAEACDAIVKSTNIFTPNGDGINDFLAFDLVELYPGSTLQVFNRWGKLIYEDSDYYNDWDGDNHKAGTYFYVLDINDPSQKLLKGTFTLVRD